MTKHSSLRVESYRTAVLSTMHMTEEDMMLFPKVAGSIFWVHDCVESVILRFRACPNWEEVLARAGFSRTLIDNLKRIALQGYDAAHFDRDAGVIKELVIDPQFSASDAPSEHSFSAEVPPNPTALLDLSDRAVTFALDMACGYPVPEMDAGILYAQMRGFDRWSMQAQIDAARNSEN